MEAQSWPVDAGRHLEAAAGQIARRNGAVYWPGLLPDLQGDTRVALGVRAGVWRYHRTWWRPDLRGAWPTNASVNRTASRILPPRSRRIRLSMSPAGPD